MTSRTLPLRHIGPHRTTFGRKVDAIRRTQAASSSHTYINDRLTVPVPEPMWSPRFVREVLTGALIVTAAIAGVVLIVAGVAG